MEATKVAGSGSGAITLQVKAQGSPSTAIQRATTGVYTVSQDVVTLNVAADVAYALQGSLAWDEASKTVSQAVGGSTQATLTISGLNPHPVEHTIDITVTGTESVDWSISSGATVVGGLVRVTIPAASQSCLLYTSPSPRDVEESRMPSSA